MTLPALHRVLSAFFFVSVLLSLVLPKSYCVCAHSEATAAAAAAAAAEASEFTDAEIQLFLKEAAALEPSVGRQSRFPDFERDPHGRMHGRVGLLNAVVLAFYDSSFATHLKSRSAALLKFKAGRSRAAMLQTVGFLLRHGVDPNARDAAPFCSNMPDDVIAPSAELISFLQCGVSGLTPLHLASAVLDVELVQLLLLHGARPDLQLYSSRATAMHVASQMILWTHVHQLALNIVSQARALHSATGTLLDVDSPQFAKLGVKFQLSPLQNLLQLIASDPDEPTGSGIANADSGIPLHTSLRTVVQHLLRPPFSTLVTREVQDALRFRARRIVRMMVISGQQLDPPVDVDKRDYAGRSPAMMAARLGNADLVLDLHRAGANVGPDNVDVWGRSCADYFILGVGDSGAAYLPSELQQVVGLPAELRAESEIVEASVSVDGVGSAASSRAPKYYAQRHVKPNGASGPPELKKKTKKKKKKKTKETAKKRIDGKNKQAIPRVLADFGGETIDEVVQTLKSAAEGLGGFSARLVEPRLRGPLRCDVDVVDGLLSADDFWNHYLSKGRPVLMRGAARTLQLRHDWTLERLHDEHGDLEVTVDKLPYSDVFGANTTKTRMTLREYLDTVMTEEYLSSVEDHARDESSYLDVPDYVFSRPKQRQWKAYDEAMMSIISRLVQPLLGRQTVGNKTAWPRITNIMNAQFFLGPPGSGAPFHFHNNALNTLAWGLKRWFLVPPVRVGFDHFLVMSLSNCLWCFCNWRNVGSCCIFLNYDGKATTPFAQAPVKTWILSTTPLVGRDSCLRSLHTENATCLHPGTIQECVQQAGDIFFVPHFYGHAVFNLMDNVGFAVEFYGAEGDL